MKHTDARQTLARIDATLRLTETPLWEDPEFLAWEAGQVGDFVFGARYWPGPAHWLNSQEARHAGINVIHTVRTAPMITVRDDHSCICEVTGNPEITSASEWHGAMRITPDKYPDTVTHGPLMLGPEPETVLHTPHRSAA